MTKAEKIEILNKPAVAYYSGYNGIELKEVNDEEIIFVEGAWTGMREVHKSKVYYTNKGDPYFKTSSGVQVRLDECLRC